MFLPDCDLFVYVRQLRLYTSMTVSFSFSPFFFFNNND